MGGAATKRPVVLVVEDDVLIRMHAAETIEEAGFEVVEASNADKAVAILEARHRRRVHRYPNAGIHGRAEACQSGERPLAANPHRCDFRSS